MRKEIIVTCPDCGTQLLKRPYEARKSALCQSCAAKRRIVKYPHTGKIGELTYKGGKSIHRKGYILVRIYPNSPYFSMAHKQGYIMEHRLVMAKYLERCLLPFEDVHHRNGILNDNRLENLELLTHSTHSSRPKTHKPKDAMSPEEKRMHDKLWRASWYQKRKQWYHEYYLRRKVQNH